MSTIKDIPATSLLTLRCHARDTENENPILNDREAARILQLLGKQIDNSLTGNLRKPMVTHIALRAKKYDEMAVRFLSQNPDGTIVNIGCGFDHRFLRIDNGKVCFFDLDLPELIHQKQKIVPTTERYQMLATSVFDYQWFRKIPEGPLLLLAEGVFMYCPGKDVKELFSKLADHFGSFNIFFEVFNSKWLSGWRQRIVEKKLNQELELGDDAVFISGIAHNRELEEWDTRLQFVEDWNYLDTDHPKLGILRYFKNIPLFRYMQYSVYYKCSD